MNILTCFKKVSTVQLNSVFSTERLCFLTTAHRLKKFINDSDPLKCRYIGKTIINFDDEKWKPGCNKLMSELLYAKFFGDLTLQSGLLKNW